MEIDIELTEKSAKNTQRWWKLTATIDYITLQSKFNASQVTVSKLTVTAHQMINPIITGISKTPSPHDPRPTTLDLIKKKCLFI